MQKQLQLAMLLASLLAAATGLRAQQPALSLNAQEYYEARGLNVLVFSNWYSGLFSDSKLSGIELIQHGERIATNGDVRLSNSPEQWDPIPTMGERRVLEGGRIQASLSYPDHQFSYRIEAVPDREGVLVSVHLDSPLPAALAGRAGFNLEFLPTAYFGKSYVAGNTVGLFPREAAGPMYREPATGAFEPSPLARGGTLVLAPEDPERRVTIDGRGALLSLYDGRNRAQNGWFVVRSFLPSGRTGKVLEWSIVPNRIPGWTRTPVIAHSQVGYHPAQEKVAVLELDPNYSGPRTVSLQRITPEGTFVDALKGDAKPWGPFLRYQYATFDFSSVREVGLYQLLFGEVRTAPFPIGPQVYDAALWSTTLDTFLPVQMDHIFVNDRYRVWHGRSHMDDARQAPVAHEHFDLYAQGPTTDTRFAPGEHIPGLNVGGWYDAGDFDIRTQTQYAAVITLAQAYETFGIDWDETTVDRRRGWVELRRPDGVPDMVQQIEHGALGLLAQYRAIGHAIPGIIAPTLDQYTHLGDGASKTDNLIYDATLDSTQATSTHSGVPDDRWAFTSKSTPLDYGAAGALAAASRVLRTFNPRLAEECLSTARRVWDEEHSRPPVIFRFGNTTGGRLEDEEVRAAVELLIATRGEAKYAQRLGELLPTPQDGFGGHLPAAIRAMPFMDATWSSRVRSAVAAGQAQRDTMQRATPFGVPVAAGGWGGSGGVLALAMSNYIQHRAFPDLVGPETTLRGLAYVLGTHPANDVSMVSGIGARSKTNAYGSNRADYSFIPGGIVPGIVIVQPDLPELMEEWPFLWYESEYVVNVAPTFIFVAHAVRELLGGG